MRAITYTRLGDPSVLELVEKPIPEPGDGEVRIRVLVSGVNPTDWKSRSGTFGGGPTEATVPNHDGAGVVDAVGAGVGGFGVGDRVWVTLAGDGRPAGGTAQEFTVVPAERVFALPVGADVELGASIGIPAVTAHRALTVAEDGPARLQPGALAGRAVLVAGGAGAMSNAPPSLQPPAGCRDVGPVDGIAQGGHLLVGLQLEHPGCGRVAGSSRIPFSASWEGVADVTSGRPVTADTVFRIASVTKTMTAIGLL